jgi:hypothetical protein
LEAAAPAISENKPISSPASACRGSRVKSTMRAPVPTALQRGVICLAWPPAVADAADVTNNYTATPTLSLTAAISMADIYSKLLCSDLP